jgi:hypothetical protein
MVRSPQESVRHEYGDAWSVQGGMTISWYKYFHLFLDSGFRRNDDPASSVIPGKAVGRDPESRILPCALRAT